MGKIFCNFPFTSQGDEVLPKCDLLFRKECSCTGAIFFLEGLLSIEKEDIKQKHRIFVP